jgi:hypothetical protein
MTSMLENFALFPAVVMFITSAYLAVITLQYTDLTTKTTLLTYATVLFLVAISLVTIYLIARIINRKSEKTIPIIR